MKKLLKNGEFNTCLETSDWRSSAAVLGLVRYFTYFKKDNLNYKIIGDCLFYNSEDLTEDRYLEFIEYYYGDKMYHIFVENMLHQENFTDEVIKLINDKLVANTVLKEIFSKNKFDGNNKDKILSLINENRKNIIKKSFINKSDMYKNYCNDTCLGKEKCDCCRLLGYYIDFNRKGKSVSYNFNKLNYNFEDYIELDFIPFAFAGDRESFFINDNMSIEQLKSTNNSFRSKVLENKTDDKERIDSRKILFKSIIESSNFIDYDIEVIVKNQEKDFFETLYIRKDNIKILNKINDFYDIFCFSVKDNYWINVQREVVNCILNNIRTDKLINMFLKNKKSSFVVSKLIKVNLLIENGDEAMEKKTKVAYACAKEVAKKIPENKLGSYRQKLTSAIVFNDYDRVCEILLQLSNYSNVDFDFAYDLFENFEKNKDVAYSFINALTKQNKE